jgi:hypothetical protein
MNLAPSEANATMNPIVLLLLIALPVASITWTLTHEELLREPREWCLRKSQTCRNLLQRKLYYVFTCEYCLSHYVAAVFLLMTRYQLAYSGWLGYVMAEFALVWVANIYMGLFGWLRLDIKHERVEIEAEEKAVRKP